MVHMNILWFSSSTPKCTPRDTASNSHISTVLNCQTPRKLHCLSMPKGQLNCGLFIQKNISAMKNNYDWIQQYEWISPINFVGKKPNIAEYIQQNCIYLRFKNRYNYTTKLESRQSLIWQRKKGWKVDEHKKYFRLLAICFLDWVLVSWVFNLWWSTELHICNPCTFLYVCTKLPSHLKKRYLNK